MLTPDVDVNVSLGNWPFQHFMIDTAADLAAHMRKQGIKTSLVCSVESILFPDPDLNDEICFKAIKRYKGLRAVKTVNPILGNWTDSLDDFIKRFDIAAIKLYPNYHFYELTDKRVNELMAYAAKAKLPVLIPVRVEDPRSHYRGLTIPDVKPDAILKLAKKHPKATIIALNAYYYELGSFKKAPTNLFTDFAFCERPDTLKCVTDLVPVKQLVFGSATPYLTTEAALAKLNTGTLPKKDRTQITRTTSRLFK